jgi:hypothetical protein
MGSFFIFKSEDETIFFTLVVKPFPNKNFSFARIIGWLNFSIIKFFCYKIKY